jgi:integrase
MPKKTKKRGNLCITFNSGECSYYIFEYLKERDSLGYSLKPDTPLFHTYKNPDFLSNNAIPRMFQKLNNELHLGKDKNRNYVKFRAHNLRKLFSTTCRRNMSKTAINMDNYTELDIISVFMGHTPPNAKNSYVYVAVDDVDSPDNYLRQTYEALMPYFRIDTDNKLLATPAKEIKSFNEI